MLQRIEAAIARLEAAALRAGHPPSPDPEREKLAATNARLRDAIAASLRQIDSLIARHDAGQEP